MDFETYDRISDNPANLNCCPKKCGITTLIIEQDMHLECECDWFQNNKYGEYGDEDSSFEDEPLK